MGKVANAESGLLGIFSEGVVAYRKKKWQDAVEAFGRVISAPPQAGDDDKAPDVRGRARAYQAIAQAHLDNVSPQPETGNDLLWDGLFLLNSGSLEGAGARLTAALSARDTEDKAYVRYLLSLVHARRGDAVAAAEFLRDAIQEEAAYRVLAFNERDLASLREHPAIKSLLG